MEKLIKKIFDKSKSEKVDLKVATAMLRKEYQDKGKMNDTIQNKFTVCEDIIHQHYSKLCDIYNQTGLKNFKVKDLYEK